MHISLRRLALLTIAQITLLCGASHASLADMVSTESDVTSVDNSNTRFNAPAYRPTFNLRTQPAQIAETVFTGGVIRAGSLDFDVVALGALEFGVAYNLQGYRWSVLDLPLAPALAGIGVTRHELGATLGFRVGGSHVGSALIWRTQVYRVREAGKAQASDRELLAFKNFGHRLTSEWVYRYSTPRHWNFEAGLGMTWISRQLQTYLAQATLGWRAFPSVSLAVGYAF